jgi:hypothetical protein
MTRLLELWLRLTGYLDQRFGSTIARAIAFGLTASVVLTVVDYMSKSDELGRSGVFAPNDGYHHALIAAAHGLLVAVIATTVVVALGAARRH